MSIMLICTLGVRDLLLDNEQIRLPREKGKEILDDFTNYYSRLSYPIIQPALEYIFNDKKHERIDRVVLVVTDQNEKNTKPAHRAKDTIEFARILQRVIEKHYGQKKIAQINLVKITQNPNFIDEMYIFFGKTLDFNKALKMENLETCYVEQAGGIPSANMALLFQCINKFEEKCSPVYVSEKTGHAIPIKFTEAILHDKRKALLLELADKFYYALLCDHLDSNKENEKLIFILSQYAQHRLCFDTSTAISIAKQGVGEFLSKDRNMFEDFIVDLEKIGQKDHVSLISELYYNMTVKYSQKEFVDFLGRIYRFKEAVLRYLFEDNTGVSTDIDGKTGKPTVFFNFIEENTELRDFVTSEKTPQGSQINLSSFGIPLLKACLKYFANKKSDTSYQEIYEILQKFDILITLRNKSIVGHGFEGVSEEIVRSKYNGDILDDLKLIIDKIFNLSGIAIPGNPFEKISSILTEKIKKIF